MKKLSKIWPLLALLAVASSAMAEDARFVGRDGDWFTPSNWDIGRVPSRGDDVEIGAGKAVVIDPARGGATVVIRDLHIQRGGSLETLPGTRFGTRNELVLGSLIHRGTDATIGGLRGVAVYAGEGDETEQGWSMNPSPKCKRIIALQSSLTVGLGGTEAAGPGRVGQGFYGNLTGQTVVVGGTLDVSFHYGFTPRNGDRFSIIKARRVVGQFRNLPEGALVKRVGDIGLYIHYTAREHILLARQISP